MNPVIASYSDFSAQSVFEIQPRYEAIKSVKKKRISLKHSLDKKMRQSTVDKFEMRSVVLIDTNLPEKVAGQRPKTTKDKRKAPLDNKSDQPGLDWNFKPWTRHRENWLFVKAKPESHFTPKVSVKKIPLSIEAIAIRNSLNK